MPTGIVDSLWFDVEERCREFGDEFDAWQDGLGQLALGLRADGMFAATIGGVVLSIPRQVAKTFIVGRIVVALCTLYPNLTILWTAHRVRTATRTFESLKGFVSRKAVKAYLLPTRNDGIKSGHSDQEIRFSNGSVILFGAREQGFGRGFEEVDVEVFDEAQILTESALEDMVPATNQSRFPHGALLFFMGTPPRPKDPGEEFANRRKEALGAKPPTVVVAEHGDALYVECSADENIGRPDGPSLMDHEQWMRANPSYPHRTPEASMLRMRKNLTNDDSWRREAMGVWDGDGVKMWQTVGRQQWADLAIPVAPADGTLAYAVKFSADGQRVAAAGAVQPDGGPVHVEAFGVHPMSEGTSSLVSWLAERWRKAAVILVDGKAGAGDLRTQLIASGVSARRVRVVTTDEAITAHAGFLRAIHEGSVTHAGQPGLDAQVRVAGQRTIGTAGGWGWKAVTADGDVTALDAVTLARFGAVTGKRKTGEGRTPSEGRTTSNRRAVVLA
jgi:hypothetical protein